MKHRAMIKGVKSEELINRVCQYRLYFFMFNMTVKLSFQFVFNVWEALNKVI